MPVFERPPLETLTPSKDRWTPVYLEHGRLEVDDSSVKWIGADHTIIRLPVATLSAVLLGPGTVVTHAAIKACSESNTPICWVGAEGLKFYSFGTTPTHDNERALHHAMVHADKGKRLEVARRMFAMRFGDEEQIADKSVKELMGMEGKRIKALYSELGSKYGITWRARKYDPGNWGLADGINRAISAANAALYALVTGTVCSMGYLPQLGFIHSAGTMPFVFDIADLYKPETTLPAAFSTLAVKPDADEHQVISRLKSLIEERRIMQKMPMDIGRLLDFPGRRRGKARNKFNESC